MAVTAHDDAVKAAASALSVHLGDPGDWYDIAAVAVAAAAPILRAPVQAEVKRLNQACEAWEGLHDDRRTELVEARAEVHAVDDLRADTLRDLIATRARAEQAERERDEAVAAERHRIAAAIRAACLRVGHSWDDFGIPRVCWTCDNAAAIAETPMKETE